MHVLHMQDNAAGRITGDCDGKGRHAVKGSRALAEEHVVMWHCTLLKVHRCLTRLTVPYGIRGTSPVSSLVYTGMCGVSGMS